MEMELEIAMYLERRGKGIGGSPCSLAQGVLLAVVAVAALVEAAVAADMGTAMDIGLVRKAMAFRVKYRLSENRKPISLSRLGVHPQNRGGMYPQPDTVNNLGLTIIRK